jgi:hypothetical protein
MKYFMAIWNISWRFGIFYDHLVDFVFIWYIFPVLVSCNKKNLATLVYYMGRLNKYVEYFIGAFAMENFQVFFYVGLGGLGSLGEVFHRVARFFLVLHTK